MILPGSGVSSYDKEKKWIQEVQDYFKLAYEKYPHLKFLVICFGL